MYKVNVGLPVSRFNTCDELFIITWSCLPSEKAFLRNFSCCVTVTSYVIFSNVFYIILIFFLRIQKWYSDSEHHYTRHYNIMDSQRLCCL